MRCYWCGFFFVWKMKQNSQTFLFHPIALQFSTKRGRCIRQSSYKYELCGLHDVVFEAEDTSSQNGLTRAPRIFTRPRGKSGDASTKVYELPLTASSPIVTAQYKGLSLRKTFFFLINISYPTRVHVIIVN